jgi:hypothetical protein
LLELGDGHLTLARQCRRLQREVLVARHQHVLEGTHRRLAP